MDFIGNKCPVCDHYFHADDDVVVCPDCGTPHHRECYESIGHCANAELHAEGYDYSEDKNNNSNADVVICKSCGKENDKYQFFCKYCAAPLQAEERHKSAENNTANQQPFGVGMDGMPFMDPLGGVAADTDLGDDITAGEAAKYVKQNTPYFVRIFSNIKSFNKSKFNFSAALFSGGYLLYRKMYKLGALIMAVEVALYFAMMYIMFTSQELYTNFMNAYASGWGKSSEFLAGLSTADTFKLYFPTIVYTLLVAVMVITGANFNRWYMKHCKSEITKIKLTANEGENPEMILQTKGGVNTALAISLLITALIIRYIPAIIAGMI